MYWPRHLNESDESPRDMAVLGENAEASQRLSAILLLSITATLCLSLSLFEVFVL